MYISYYYFATAYIFYRKIFSFWCRWELMLYWLVIHGLKIRAFIIITDEIDTFIASHVKDSPKKGSGLYRISWKSGWCFSKAVLLQMYNWCYSTMNPVIIKVSRAERFWSWWICFRSPQLPLKQQPLAVLYYQKIPFSVTWLSVVVKARIHNHVSVNCLGSFVRKSESDKKNLIHFTTQNVELHLTLLQRFFPAAVLKPITQLYYN